MGELRRGWFFVHVERSPIHPSKLPRPQSPAAISSVLLGEKKHGRHEEQDGRDHHGLEASQ
jgi:hypothetical protein